MATTPQKDDISTKSLTGRVYALFDIFVREKTFLVAILVMIVLAGVLTPYAHLAMWFGFAIAAYSAIANDSIQTIGTFIASNSKRPWWLMWLFMGLIFVGVVTFSWVAYDGDVSWGRLNHKGFEVAPTSFEFLQLAAPIVLLILTRMRMPVSTTFLLLSCFATKGSAIGKVMAKSFGGYFIAFAAAVVVWLLVYYLFKTFKWKLKRKVHPGWMVAQWIISGSLWGFWLMQDAANIAVFLPRSLSTGEFLAFTLFIFGGLGLLFYLKGDRIQKIVNEKSGVTDLRAATLVDFVYALILVYHTIDSTVPMSTTWVFLGLLGGRELTISLTKKRKKLRKARFKTALAMIGKDALFAIIGLIISLAIAMLVNKPVRDGILESLGM